MLSPTALVNPNDEFPFFEEIKMMSGAKKGGIRNLNIEELELRAVLKMMENKFS